MEQFRQPLNSPRQITNDEVEAVIKMATSSRSPAGSLKDTRTQLFVGNLPYRVRWQDLKDLFRRAGTVLRADVSLGPDNRSRGYGTVLLATAEDAGRAIDMFNGYSWQSRVLEVRPDRLPPDYDVNLPASFSNAAAAHLGSQGRPLEVLDYSTLLDLQNSLPSLPSRNLFVGNLPFHCQWQDLKDLFRQAGTIIRADVALSQDGRSRGFGTVSFATEQDAERAVKMFNGYEYNGRALKVNFDRFAQLSGGASQAQSSTPSALTSAAVSALASPVTIGPSAESQLLMPTALHDIDKIKPPSAASTSYRLGLNPSTSSSPSHYDAWSSATSPLLAHLNGREDSDQELTHNLGRLDLESRSASALMGLKLRQSQVSSNARSMSDSSSGRPQSLKTTTSSSSAVSTSSSVAASVSTSNTSEKSTPPQVPPLLGKDRRLSTSSSSRASLVHSSASSSSASSPVAQHSSGSPLSAPLAAQLGQALASQAKSAGISTRRVPASRRPTNSQPLHPRHPGPISLPPRPSVNAFPSYILPSNMSPGQYPGVSPLHHPLGSPTAAMFHPGTAHIATPHGLQMMTPSMPPFNFHHPGPLGSPGIPAPLGSPGLAPHPSGHVYQTYPMSSPVLAVHPIHMQPQMHPHTHAMQPSPLHHPTQQAHHAPFGITPISPAQSQNVHTPLALGNFGSTSGNGNGNGGNGGGNAGNSGMAVAAAQAQAQAHAQAQAQAVNEAMSQQATAMAMYPYTHGVAFSPGLMMSPGAVWSGQRTVGGANPMMNPAVGGPVFMQQMREPSGYFEGYFPPVQNQQQQPQPQSGSSLVESEILKYPEGHGAGLYGFKAEGANEDEDDGDFIEVSSGEGVPEEAKLYAKEKKRRHSTTTTSSSETATRQKRNSGSDHGENLHESAVTDSEEGTASIMTRAHSMKNPARSHPDTLPRGQSEPKLKNRTSTTEVVEEEDASTASRYGGMPLSAQ